MSPKIAVVGEPILIALVPGAPQGLLAAAIVFSWRAAGVPNVGIGVFGAVGALIVALLAGVAPLPAALVCGFGVSALMAGAVGLLVPSPTPRRTGMTSLLFVLAAVTVGVLLSLLWPVGLQFPSILPETVLTIGRYRVAPLQLIALVLGAAGAAAISILFVVTGARRGNVRAPFATTPGGRLAVCAVSGVMAAVAACLIAQMSFAGPSMFVPSVMAIIATAIAGFRSPTVAFGAGLALEVARTVLVEHQTAHAGYGEAVAVVVLLGVLLWVARWFLLGRPHPRLTGSLSR